MGILKQRKIQISQRWFLPGAAVLIVLLLVAACSGSSDGQTVTTAPPTPVTSAEAVQEIPSEPTESIAASATDALLTATLPPSTPALTPAPASTPPPTRTAEPTPAGATTTQPTMDPAGRSGGGGRFQVLDIPVMIPASQALWLDPEEIVMGVVHNGEAQAFPIGQMAYHHIANTEIGGEPYLVTY